MCALTRSQNTGTRESVMRPFAKSRPENIATDSAVGIRTSLEQKYRFARYRRRTCKIAGHVATYALVGIPYVYLILEYLFGIHGHYARVVFFLAFASYPALTILVRWGGHNLRPYLLQDMSSPPVGTPEEQDTCILRTKEELEEGDRWFWYAPFLIFTDCVCYIALVMSYIFRSKYTERQTL